MNLQSKEPLIIIRDKGIIQVLDTKDVIHHQNIAKITEEKFLQPKDNTSTNMKILSLQAKTI